MKTDQSQSRIGNAFLVFSLLFGIGIALSMTAQAQNPDDRYTQDRNRSDNGDQNRRGRDWDRYGNYGGSSELRRTALNAGYDEGVKEGRKDRGNGSRTEHRNLSSYQKATKDYSPRLGDRELYRRYFREAFEDGYNAESYARGNRNREDRNGNRDRNDNGNQDRLRPQRGWLRQLRGLVPVASNRSERWFRRGRQTRPQRSQRTQRQWLPAPEYLPESNEGL